MLIRLAAIIGISALGLGCKSVPQGNENSNILHPIYLQQASAPPDANEDTEESSSKAPKLSLSRIEKSQLRPDQANVTPEIRQEAAENKTELVSYTYRFIKLKGSTKRSKIKIKVVPRKKTPSDH